ncbi:MAG: LCP family protein [Acidimicrobiaceae bacterium]|nr:LCP family protein [Acidimicrobiaceae bacterium]
MSNRQDKARFRRSWPQRLTVLASLAVIVVAVASAETVQYVEEVWEEYEPVQFPGTVQYGRELLRSATEPGEPVNFLVVGTDSSVDVAPGAASGINAAGRALADVIMLVRLDPESLSAWVLSIPRDLWAEIPGAQDHKINSALLIGGAPLLVETVTSMFDVEINHYVEIDFAGFQQVVDTLGGVPVWFDHPARDPKSQLNIATSGCHVLDGEQALQYVRSRTYTELIDGRWRVTGGNDFHRIARQQDFLVLALDRAIARGARNPAAMIGMINAGADLVSFDQDLTLGELVSLARDFSGFSPENLNRERLEVYTLYWPDGRYKGEADAGSVNEPRLEVFRGASDGASPADVVLRLAGFNDSKLSDASAGLRGEGFEILGHFLAPAIPETVILHGTGAEDAALTVARYLDPIPYVVADERVEGVITVLGVDYRGVLVLAPEPFSVARERAEARGVPVVLPDPADGFAPVGTGSSGASGRPATPVSGTPVSGTAVSGAAVAASAGPATAVVAVQAAAQASRDDPPSSRVRGRPPAGESCG